MTAQDKTDRPCILVIDDEPDLRTLYEFSLVREGYLVQSAETLTQALTVLQHQQFDAVISDMRLPDGLGLEVVKFLSQERRPERCIVITAYGSAENAVEALKAGAFDYLTKPIDLKQFRAVVAQAVKVSNPNQSLASLTVSQKIDSPAPPSVLTAKVLPDAKESQTALARLVGQSEVMQDVRARIQKVARSMAPVLIRGESGTGKELVAKAIHACSHRALGPFVAVNCGAIPENLLEAEFFGSRKGAFTGAVQDRVGYFQAAHGGTLFLDEIGDLPISMQAKLLRAIQERSIRPLGATLEEMVDVRILSATHHDLSALVNSATFRQDLYYRLNVIEIGLPALRERREDLAQLAQALLNRISLESAQPPQHISQKMLTELESLPLVGNVRELENLIHRALALSDAEPLDLHLEMQDQDEKLYSKTIENTNAASQAAAAEADALISQNQIPPDLQAHMDEQERAILLRALTLAGFNRTAAASRLGITLRQIRYRMVRLGIEVPGEAAEKDDEAAT